MTESKLPPFRNIAATPPEVEMLRRADGTVLLRHPRKLDNYAPTLISFLHRWSLEQPDRTFLAKRGADGAWVRWSYARARVQADAIAQSLIDRGLGPGDTMLILSGNSIEHAAVLLGAMTVGVIVAPVSPAYSLMSTDLAKLRSIAQTLNPRAIFVQDVDPYRRALSTIAMGAQVVAVHNVDEWPGAIRFADLVSAKPGREVDDAFATVGPDSIAKVLFTSGSTGWPKGVLNTHRMMCANVAMYASIWTGQGEEPVKTISWLPWNHTMAGNGFFNSTLGSGGTYYLDEGRPTSTAEFARTLANLVDVCPCNYTDVPLSFTMLADALENNSAMSQELFLRLEHLTYAGAALPDELCSRLQALSVRATGRRIPILSGYGSTETAPGFLLQYWPVEGSGFVGLPYPGAEAKLLPLGDGRYEIRARGPNVTPGYFGEPNLSATAFDDEGFYSLGDAVRFVDEDAPLKGLRFAGRIAEDFKLLSGTFVSAGTVRAALVGALSPFLLDAVITGEGRASLGALAWINLAAAREALASECAGMSSEQLFRSSELRNRLAKLVGEYNRDYPGSSTRIDRIRLLEVEPSVDANEITDKGYINRRMVLEHRANDVAALYDDQNPEIIRPLPA